MTPKKFYLIENHRQPRLYLTRDLLLCAVWFAVPIAALVWSVAL